MHTVCEQAQAGETGQWSQETGAVRGQLACPGGTMQTGRYRHLSCHTGGYKRLCPHKPRVMTAKTKYFFFNFIKTFHKKPPNKF